MPPRTRAHTACGWCRARKVRCDAVTFNRACTRCIQDGRDDCSLRKKDLSVHRVSSNRANSARSPSTHSRTTLPLGHVPFSSYPFLNLGGFENLEEGDVTFLASKGCLGLPNRAAVDEFIKQYFLQVHPWAPVIDEAKFWDVYQSDGEIPATSKISLLVFQSLLFMSAPYVSVETLQACGVEDKRTAWKMLYNRAKLLFDFKAEDRQLAQAQAAFLLSFYTSTDEPQAASLWLTRSIQVTMTLDPQDIETSSMKRLWWSIVLRDRRLCLALRRRAQITSIGAGMPIKFLNEEDFADEIQSSRVYDPEIKRILFTILQEQCRLAVLLTDMVTLIFTSNGLARPLLSLSEFHDTSIRIRQVRSSLEHWESSFSLLAVKNAPSAVTQLINMTLMYYHTAQMDLAHYQAILIENHLPFVGDDYYRLIWNTGTVLHNSMNCLTEIMEYFGQLGRVQSFPLGMLACVVSPLVLTAINLKLSTSAPEMGHRRQRLERLGEVVRQSGRVYDVTDFISICTNQILELAYVTYRRLYHNDPTFTTNSVSSLSSAGILPQARRVKSWQDAFLQSPRAYLLISISLDYYLSVGRLPIENALPEFVRCMPCFGDQLRLPWNIRIPESKDNSLNNDKESVRSSTPSVVAPFGYSIANFFETPDQDIGMDHGQDSTPLTDLSRPGSSHINIDFMSFDNITLSPADTHLTRPDSCIEFDDHPGLEDSILPKPDQLSMPHDVFICSLSDDGFDAMPVIPEIAGST